MDYRQCKVVKKTEAGKVEMTTWLPLPFAKKGKPLKLKENDVWQDGWVVKKVYSSRLKEKEVFRNSESYKKQREVSDI